MHASDEYVMFGLLRMNAKSITDCSLLDRVPTVAQPRITWTPWPNTQPNVTTKFSLFISDFVLFFSILRWLSDSPRFPVSRFNRQSRVQEES